MSSKLLLIFAAFYFAHQNVEAIRCYSCSIGENDQDQSCVDNLNNDMIINCNMRYCRTIRQDFVDPKGKVASIYRGCDDNPNPKNEVIEDFTHKIYYTACQQDLCNGGTGKGADNKKGSLGDKSMLLVPGLPASALRNVVSGLTLILSLLIVLI